jgi:hypothetical protein
MSKYVPPNKRDAPKVILPKKEEFPMLCSTNTKPSIWSGKSFSSLATEWKNKDQEEKQNREIAEEIEKNKRHREEIIIVRKRQYQSDHYSPYFEDENNLRNDDEWTTVEKKVRPSLTIEEKIERDEFLEKQEIKQMEDDSVWQTEEWDFRDRRVYS